jgi:hypothetical protein
MEGKGSFPYFQGLGRRVNLNVGVKYILMLLNIINCQKCHLLPKVVQKRETYLRKGLLASTNLLEVH